MLLICICPEFITEQLTETYIPRHMSHMSQDITQWAIQDSNLGPLPYQRSALTN